MRALSIIFVAIAYCILIAGEVKADDLKINTPVVSMNLIGQWELQPQEAGTYKQTIHLGPQFTGEWHQNRETLPVSIAWFVEGGELRLLHYYEPDVPFNYRVKTLMVGYKLSNDDDSLTLSIDGKSTMWKRVKEVAPSK